MLTKNIKYDFKFSHGGKTTKKQSISRRKQEREAMAKKTRQKSVMLFKNIK